MYKITIVDDCDKEISLEGESIVVLAGNRLGMNGVIDAATEIIAQAIKESPRLLQAAGDALIDDGGDE